MFIRKLILLLFAGLLAGCVPAAPAADIVTLYIAPQTVPCIGVGPQECLQVRESPEAEWELFYDQIEGFSFEPGYEYKLQVERVKVENPPADGSSIRFILVEVVSLTEAQALDADNNPLLDTTWDLAGYGNPEDLTAPTAGTAPNIHFSAEGVSGHAGCNSFFGSSYSISGDQIIWDGTAFGMTEMYCDDEAVMAQESQLLEMLQGVERFELEEGHLTLFTPDGVLVFVTPASATLEGTTWVLSGTVVGGDAVVHSSGDENITAQFADGMISGFAGCNQYHGSYEIQEDGTIRFSPMGATRMACEPSEIMDREMEFLTLFEQAASYTIERYNLTLFNEYGDMILILRSNLAPGNMLP